MNQNIKNLSEKLKAHRALKKVVEKTKEKGFQDGRGYSYRYIRKILVYQESWNQKVIDAAIEVWNELKEKGVEKDKEKEATLLKLEKALAAS